MLTEADFEQLRQSLRDLVFIQNEVLIKKIDKLDESIDKRLQSFEQGFSVLQDTLNKLMLTFLQGQEDRHKEIARICNIINDHENRINKLENKNYESLNLGVY